VSPSIAFSVVVWLFPLDFFLLSVSTRNKK
jgi:hypothetical protein